MADLRTEFKELLHIVSKGEDLAEEHIQIYYGSVSKINLVHAKGEKKPKISFKMIENTFILSNLLLRNEEHETERFIIHWLINYAKEKELNFFKITNVKTNNIELKKMAETLQMDFSETHDEKGNKCFDYTLKLTA